MLCCESNPGRPAPSLVAVLSAVMFPAVKEPSVTLLVQEPVVPFTHMSLFVSCRLCILHQEASYIVAIVVLVIPSAVYGPPRETHFAVSSLLVP
jgi:hypothetical protein